MRIISFFCQLCLLNRKNAVGEIRRADKRHGGRADANVMALPWRAATVPPWREHITKQSAAKMLPEKYVKRTNDMAGGSTRTSWLCQGERRPSRLGVNISRKAQSRGMNTSLKTIPPWRENTTTKRLVT